MKVTSSTSDVVEVQQFSFTQDNDATKTWPERTASEIAAGMVAQEKLL